jgi:ankyrin repeat protein
MAKSKNQRLGHSDLASIVESGDSAAVHEALRGVDKRDLAVAGEPLVFRTRNILIIRSLVLAGAPIDGQSPNGVTLLHHVLFLTGHREFTAVNLLELVAGRIKKIDAKDADGFSALFLACKLSDYDAVAALCRHGADVNLQCGVDASTPLHAAVAPTVQTKHRNRIINHLISLHAKLEVFERALGWTPLMSATLMRSLVDVKSLVQAGAKIDIISLRLNDYPKETAYDIAKRMHYSEIVSYFDEQIAN